MAGLGCAGGIGKTEMDSYIIQSFDGGEEEDEEDVIDSGSTHNETNFLDGHHLIVDSQLSSDGHVMTADGQLVRLYRDGNELTAKPTMINGQPAIILTGLPYSTELLQPVTTEEIELSQQLIKEEVDEEEEDENSLRVLSKRLRLESREGETYDVVLSMSGHEASSSADASNDKSPTDETTEEIDDVEQLLDDNDLSDQTKLGERSSVQTNDVSQAWFTRKDDKMAFQDKGSKWKQGQWTKEEVDLLQSNIAQYCEERGIVNASEVVFDMTKDERKNFYRTIAKGLQRPLFSVYRRVIRMYDQKNYIGKYSQEELVKLKELRKKYGSDWATIGTMLGRSASSVKDRCRLMKDTCNTGKWYPDEEKRLTEAVYQLSGSSPGESVTSGLSWAQVAEYVNTRSEKQCRTKWLNYLNWKQKGGAEWTRDDDLLLLDRLSDISANEENDINWITMATDWPSVRSPQWLHGKWWSMKRHVADYAQMPFPELLKTVKSLHSQNVKSRSPTATGSSVTAIASGSTDGVRLNVKNLQLPGMTFTIPVMTIDGLLALEGLDNDESPNENGIQSYRLLEDVTDDDNQSQETYVITESDSNPSAIFSMNGMTIPESFIVHTIGQQANNKVLVQMNPATQQIIFTRDIHETTTFDSDESNHILSHHQVFHQLDDVHSSASRDLDETNDDHRIINNCDDELEQEEEIVCDQMVTEILTADNFDEVIIENEIDVSGSMAEGFVDVSNPLFIRSDSNDARHLMSSFSDPMLITDSSDLLSSMSDGDGEKSHGAVDDIDGS